MKKVIVFFSFFLFIWVQVQAQVEYNLSEESTMSITGTSTIHDWESAVNELNGEFVFNENVLKNKIPDSGSIIDHVIIKVPVKSIESERGSTMDNKTYEALKSEDHPDIIFEVNKDKVTSVGDGGNNSFTLYITGKLTIAGHTEDINLQLEGQFVNSNRLKFSGSYSLNMTEYEVEPPTAMFGQIKTGEEVTINFELALVKE